MRIIVTERFIKSIQKADKKKDRQRVKCKETTLKENIRKENYFDFHSSHLSSYYRKGTKPNLPQIPGIIHGSV